MFMAIYHCSIKLIDRLGGRSAVASAAYRSGEKLLNEETEITHDFTKKGNPSLPSYNPKDKENTSKYRIPVLDENGNQKTRERKGKGTEYLWERISIPANDWNEHSKAEEWRKSWAQHCNQYLTPDKQIDHRSYKRQGLDIEPTIHEGVTARQIEQRGDVSDRCWIVRRGDKQIQIKKGLPQSFKGYDSNGYSLFSCGNYRMK